jgi:hypothetical protein
VFRRHPRKSNIPIEVIVEYFFAGLAWAIGERLFNVLADRVEKWLSRRGRRRRARRPKPPHPPSHS